VKLPNEKQRCGTDFKWHEERWLAGLFFQEIDYHDTVLDHSDLWNLYFNSTQSTIKYCLVAEVVVLMVEKWR